MHFGIATTVLKKNNETEEPKLAISKLTIKLQWPKQYVTGWFFTTSAIWEALYEAIIISLFKVFLYMLIFHFPYWYHNQYCHEYLGMCVWAGVSLQYRARSRSSGLLDILVLNFSKHWWYFLHNDCSSFNCNQKYRVTISLGLCQ